MGDADKGVWRINNKMKKVIIGIIVVAIVALCVTFFFVLFPTAQPGTGIQIAPSSTTATLLPVASSSPAQAYPTGNTLPIGTSDGTVVVNNFYNAPIEVSQDHTSIVLAQVSDYTITYYAPDSGFNISISKMPLATIQPEAEAAFLKLLGISEADACKLNVKVGVPYGVDPDYAGENIPLTFCAPGAFTQ